MIKYLKFNFFEREGLLQTFSYIKINERVFTSKSIFFVKSVALKK